MSLEFSRKPRQNPDVPCRGSRSRRPEHPDVRSCRFSGRSAKIPGCTMCRHPDVRRTSCRRRRRRKYPDVRDTRMYRSAVRRRRKYPDVRRPRGSTVAADGLPAISQNRELLSLQPQRRTFLLPLSQSIFSKLVLPTYLLVPAWDPFIHSSSLNTKS